MKYFKLWLSMTGKTAQVAFQSRFGAIFFLIGKLLRFAFFLWLLVFLTERTQTIAGYTLWQVIFFYATYNLIDTIPQFLWRDVYRFRRQVLEGNFDYTLLKPMSPLFRSLFGGSDIFDTILLALSVLFIIIAASNLDGVTILGIVSYIALIINALIIALAFHIFVLGLGILTMEIDNALWIYRDITQMGRFPIDIYTQPLRAVVTFAIPVGVMMTFPAKAIMGLLSIQGIIASFIVAAILISLTWWFWRYALSRYSSASS